jgi:hypothetical protein
MAVSAGSSSCVAMYRNARVDQSAAQHARTAVNISASSSMPR